MGVVAGRDDHRVDVIVLDERDAGRVHPRTQFVRDRIGHCGVEVADRNEFRTGHHRRDLAGMVSTQDADPDNSYTHSHSVSITY